MMDILYKVFVEPFVFMVEAPDLLVQTLWEGLVSGVLYALIALGFVLIFKASGVFNFAQGHHGRVRGPDPGRPLREGRAGLPRARSSPFGAMLVLAVAVERVVLRPLVNQPDIILFMATFGLTYFLIGFGELIFGGNPKRDDHGPALPAAGHDGDRRSSAARCASSISTSPPP